jgi:hypothetical protein
MTSREKETLNTGGESPSGVKPTYESPRTVPLGELARGLARCQNGTFPADECTAGTGPIKFCDVGIGAG